MGLFNRLKGNKNKSEQYYDAQSDVAARLAQFNRAPGEVHARMVSAEQANALRNEIYGPKLEQFNREYGEVYEALKKLDSEMHSGKISETSKVIIGLFWEYDSSFKKVSPDDVLDTLVLIKSLIGAPLDYEENERINNLNGKVRSSSNADELQAYYTECKNFIFDLKHQFDSLKGVHNAVQSDSHKAR